MNILVAIDFSDVTPGMLEALARFPGTRDAHVYLVHAAEPDPEFVGWMKPGFGKISRYRAYESAMAPPKEPRMTANLGGGVRAHVASGIYEEVCGVDILPSYLMKSALARDFEEMEALGIHDCAECGLCTYVCPSKIEFGEIIADGIEEFLKEEEG